MLPILTAALPVIGKVLDKVIPDPQAREKAEAELKAMENSHEMQLLQTQMSAIVEEARSEDPWTSRARPSFLYIVYIYILAAIPMGVVFMLAPERAVEVTQGVQAWLQTIPEEMWWLFGTGYLGYTGARSWDKRRPPQSKG